MIVVDASVLTTMLVYADRRGRRARSVLARDHEWSAPEHWMVEVFSAVRGLAIGRKVSARAAQRAVGRLPTLAIDHIGVGLLLPRMWELRDVVSGYDAAYVALAETRGVALVTADRRLARAANRFCAVELVS